LRIHLLPGIKPADEPSCACDVSGASQRDAVSGTLQSERGICVIRFFCAAVLITVPLISARDAVAQTAPSISVTLSEYAVTPGEIDLKSGTTYRMHVINNGSKGHSFSAPEFFSASQVASEDQAKVANGLIELEKGQSVDIAVTPQRAGTFAAECTHFMHNMMGMHATIVVQ
jgi:uncharacterized cupredoxin-like copper-binding protein